MGILISNAVSQPSVTFDHVHLTSMVISQPTFTDDSLTPVYSVEVQYKLYGVSGGIRVYDDNLKNIVIGDYIPVASKDASVGDMRLMDALSSIEQAVAAILSEQAGYTTTIV